MDVPLRLMREAAMTRPRSIIMRFLRKLLGNLARKLEALDRTKASRILIRQTRTRMMIDVLDWVRKKAVERLSR